MSQHIGNLIYQQQEQAAHDFLIQRLLPPQTDQLIDQREQAEFAVTLTLTASTQEAPDGRISKSYTFKRPDSPYRRIHQRERDLLMKAGDLEIAKKAYVGGVREYKQRTQISGYTLDMKNLGLDLDDWLFLLDPAKEGSPWRDVRFHLKIWLETLQSLRACHQIGLLHCDLKADNICLQPHAVAKQEGETALHCTFERSWVIDLACALHPNVECIPNIQIGNVDVPPRYTQAWKKPGKGNQLGLDWRIDLYRMGNMVQHVHDVVQHRGYNFQLSPAGIENYPQLYNYLKRLPEKLRHFENIAWQEMQKNPRTQSAPPKIESYTPIIKEIENLLGSYTWPQVKLPRQRTSEAWRFYNFEQETVHIGPGDTTHIPPKTRRLRPIGAAILAAALGGGLGLGFWMKNKTEENLPVREIQAAPTPASSEPVMPAKEPSGKQLPGGQEPSVKEPPVKGPPVKAWPAGREPGQPGSSFKACTDCPEVVWLPQGNYLRGSTTATDPERHSNEGPVRKVTIAYTLAAGKYPVTFKEWDACVSDGACPKPADEGWGRDLRPVINVSYNTVTQNYLPWLNKKAQAAGKLPSGYQFALPTESEREYFARGITNANEPHPPFPSLPGTRWADGRCPHTDAFNYDGNYDYANCGAKTGVYREKTLPVNELPYPNRFGLFGVAGNIREMTRDCSYNDYNQTPDNGDPAKETAGCKRVVRSGSWINDPRWYLRAAYRDYISAGSAFYDLGFRLVLSPRI